MKNVKYISILVYLGFTFMLSGCVEQKLHTPTIKNMSDVKLKVDKNGEIGIEKRHTFKDGNSTVEIEKLSSHDEKTYEKVPTFLGKDFTNIYLKDKKNRKKDIVKIRKNGKVKISVEAIPVNEFINLVFGNVLKLNYTVTQDIKKMKNPITLNMSEDAPKKQIFNVILKLLSFENIHVVKQDGMFYISVKDSVVKEDISSYIGYGREISDKILDNQKIVQFVPFKYIAASKATNFLKYAGVSRSVGYDYPSGNISAMRGKAGEIRKALQIIKLLDRPYLADKTTYLVDFKNIEVSDFIERMKSIFASNGVKVAELPTGVGIIMNPIPELNSILVISPKQSWIDMLLYWKNKLDVELQASNEPKFYIYKVKNRKADKLAASLNSVLSITANNNSLQKIDKKLKNKTQAKIIVSKRKKSVKFDLATNILMMQLLPSEYRKLLPIIEQLDALPKQVLVEVTLAEVTLTDTFNLGFEYKLRNDIAAKGNSVTDAIVTSALGGSGFAATYSSKQIDSTINAYAANKLLSIMSRPKILILNNQTGSINVGTQVPIIQSEVSTQLGGNAPAINRNVTYRTTGVVVGLTPTINSNGILTMNISLNLSEAQLNSTSGIDSPLIVTRALSTSLTLKSGETVLMGGLISKNKSTSDSGVPILMDIPWLGNIFKSTSTKFVKTELIMLIKPYIIKNTTELSEKTRKYKKILNLLKEYSLF